MKSLLITVRLALQTPGGVTAPEDRSIREVTGPNGERRDRNLLPLRRTPDGALEIPATTIAGSLRSHCSPDPALAGLFGSEPGETELVASTLQVLGCLLRVQPHVAQRARTAIDRRRGAPANRTLHAVEQLPAGTTVDVVLRWNDADPGRLAALLDAVTSWVPRLGRGSSVGAGRCAVVGLGTAEYDLASVDGLRSWLAIEGPQDYPEPSPTTPATPTVIRDVRFRIVEALHIGTGTTRKDAQGREIACLLRGGDGPVVPGSSLKGVLRSRVEYICRVSGTDACPGSAPPACPAERPCPPCRLFGRAGGTGGEGGRRAAIAIPDASIVDPQLETRTHVALDRFTGGARDQLLFTDDVVTAGTFTVRVDDLGEALTPVDAALLDAALADLDAGLVGIGARTTAGYGTVRIDDPRWTPPDLTTVAGLLARETT